MYAVLGLSVFATGWGGCGFRTGTANRGIAVVAEYGHIVGSIRVGEGSDPKSLYFEPIFSWGSYFFIGGGLFFQPGDVVWGNPPRRMSSVGIPLSIPLLFVAIPTAWLWLIDRRAEPWQCAKCRYDLRGLGGGVCPECGESTTGAPA